MLRDHWFSTSRRSGSAASSAGPALAAALLWAAAAGSVLLWWLHRPAAGVSEVTPAGLLTTATPSPSPELVARALGQAQASAAAPELQQRFVLLGVVGTEAGRGSALLAVDGQPAKAFVRGQSVAEGWRLDAVQPRGVRLAPEGGGAGLELAVPSTR